MSNSLYYYKTSLNFIDGIKIHVVQKENHTTISQLTDVSRIECLKTNIIETHHQRNHQVQHYCI